MVETYEGKIRYASCGICVKEIETTPKMRNKISKYVRITEEMIGKRKIVEFNETRPERFRAYDMGGRSDLLMNRYEGFMAGMDVTLRDEDDIIELNGWNADEGTEILTELRTRIRRIIEIEKNEITEYLKENFMGWEHQELEKFIMRLVAGLVEREKQLENSLLIMKAMDEKYRWIMMLKTSLQELRREVDELRRTMGELEDIVKEEKEEVEKKN